MNNTYRKKPVEIQAFEYDGLPIDVFNWVTSNGDSYENNFIEDWETQSSPLLKVKTLEGTSYDVPDGYYIIRGVKGEYYPCAPDIFKATYDNVNNEESGLNFGTAIRCLKAGGRVARSGWNGKNMFLYYVPEANYPAMTRVAKEHFGEDSLVPYGAYIAMKTAQNNVVPWLASQTDVLAEDWEVLK